MDFAVSTDPAVQAQLDRLWALSPGADILGLSRVTELLARLGDPHFALPPVFHVAGTNGKGSTCAFLRAALEADDKLVHVYTSPHLVRFNERIRLAGKLIDDAALAALLERVLDHAEGIGASFFEVTTAAAFLAFAETPADACVIEVGLGGRLDATNVIADPAVCGIAQLGIDHQAFLGDTIESIAYEKAGIGKPGRPLVIHSQSFNIRAAIAHGAGEAKIVAEGEDWSFRIEDDASLSIQDGRGSIRTPGPALIGTHQHANLALAIEMIRNQDRVPVAEESLRAAPLAARWPARMQRLADGPLTRRAKGPVWLDGGHNPAAADAVAAALADQLGDGQVHLILGMLVNKDAAGLLAPFAPLVASLTAVPVPGHEHHAPEVLAELAGEFGIPADTAPDVPAALDAAPAGTTLILGSLYLAGIVLALNDEPPM
ncbi:bifunctional folylpolyglutamate synthase/dihydrofolate synthase [Sphingomonas cannabina]|uniref:bifunctional folylpolyglutamate synthase/dihydrofolate synthase n=1 Tax=Sphingomonas cannabina TaxID=2899123 RepID=UPI001F2044CF|nr:folylpolyglutamate synthase/dihydrofolate synthase family protein [Sphingomonas cannabina]UIJ43970.1 bifunctional folylpolyglutamate synthase/dihydrofolate synthase [Sphingomonas cannabina]